MVTSEVQARAIQTRRVAAGKRGVAKAVRRWFARTYKLPAIAIRGHNLQLPASFEGCRSYEEIRKGSKDAT